MSDLAELEVRLRLNAIGAEEAARKLAAVSENVKRLEAQYLKAESANERFGRGLGTVGITAEKAANGQIRYREELGRFAAGAGGATASINGLALALGAFAGARQAVRTIAEFGDVMAQLRGVAISTTDSLDSQAAQFGQLEETAKRFATTSRFGATEVAKGLLELGRAGFDAQKSLETIPAVLNLAQGGAIALGDAATIVVNALSQFSLGADQSTRVVDVLVKAANQSTTSVEELGASLRFAGTVAGGLGIPLEDTAASLEVLANAGLRGAQGGTVLRSVIVTLQKPTLEARDALRQMGLTTKDVNPALHSLGEIFTTLQSHGLSAANAVHIFNQRNEAGALALVKSADKIDEFAGGLRNAGGEGQRLADIMNDTLGGALDRAGHSIQTLIIDIGESALGKALTSFIQDFADGVQVISEFLHFMGLLKTQTSGLDSELHKAASSIEDLQTKAADIAHIQIATGVDDDLAAQIHDKALLQEQEISRQLDVYREIEAENQGLTVEQLKKQEETLSRQFQLTARHSQLLRESKDLEKLLGRPLRGAEEIKAGSREPSPEEFEQIEVRNRAEESLKKSFDALSREREALTLNSREREVANDLRKIEEQGINAEVDDLETLIERYRDADLAVKLLADTEKAARAIESQLKPGTDVIAHETQLLNLNSDQREIAIKLLATERIGRELGVKNVDDFVAALGRLLVQQKQFEVKTKIADSLRENRDALELERASINLDANDRQALIGVMKLEQEARRLGVTGTSAEIDELKKLAVERGRVQRSLGITDQILDNVGALNRETNAYEGTNGTLNERLRREENLHTLATLTIEDRERLAEAIDAEGSSVKRLADRLEEQYKISQRTKISTDIGNRIKDIDFERKTLKLTDDERERAIALREFENRAIADGITNLDGEIDRLDRELKGLQRDRAAREAAQDVAQAFGDAFEGILTGANTLREGLKSIFQDISKDVLEKEAIKPFEDFLTSFLTGGSGGSQTGGGFSALLAGLLGVHGGPGQNARGNIFTLGQGAPSLVPYAFGGLPDIINQPTIFPMRGGRTGIAGEAGTEGAIAPLVRTSSGRLGVEAVGGGSSTVVNQTFNITTPDADSFRRSRRQILADVRGVGGGVR